MFEKFGEFDSCEEINLAAEGLYNEGDVKSLYLLAEENGIPQDFAAHYAAGELPELCDPMTAAIGKLEVEKEQKEVKDYNSKIPAEPIIEYLSGQCEKEVMARAIRRKDKNLVECLRYIEREARKIVTRARPWLHDAAVYKMARDYYLGGAK